MNPVPEKTIEHFSHPGHRLEELNAETEYTCDGCKTLGHGSSYQCNACNFVMHEYCGTCPRSLSSFMHSHPLTLVVRKAQGTQNNRICNVCGDPVKGLFYRCKDCDFDVHPVCTLLPQQLRHALDQAHPLMFEAPKLPSPCAVCGDECTSWRYRCSVCGLDIHLGCLLTSCVSPTQRSIRPSSGPTQCSAPPSRSTPSPRPYPMQPPPPTQRSAPPCGSTPLPRPQPPPPPPPPPYGGYAHAYGVHYGPTPYGGYPYGVPYGGYPCGVHYGPTPYDGYPYGVHYGPNPYYNTYNYGNKLSHYDPNYYYNPQAQLGGGKLERVGDRMFTLVGQLLGGVLSSVIFGMS